MDTTGNLIQKNAGRQSDDPEGMVVSLSVAVGDLDTACLTK